MTTKRAVLDDLAAVRDEARVRLHLLSMEARERWYDLEAALDSVERDLTTGEFSAKVRDRAREITGYVERLLADHPSTTGLEAKVRSAMAREVRTCLPYASLRNAVQALRSSGQGAVPVVDEEGRLLGIVTERDLCDAACLQGKPFSAITIDRAMTENVTTCSPDDSLARVLATMSDARVHELPVVDARRRVVGMLDLAAVARFVKPASPREAAACHALLDTIVAVSTTPADDRLSAAE